MRLFLEKIRLAFLKRTGGQANKKCYAAWAAKGYDNTPVVTFVFQSHNKSVAIEHVVRKVRAVAKAEIIVVDDGSSPKHTERLTRLLTGANEFLLRANDLYENIIYDRCLRMANGRYVALLQDDDDFDSTAWVDEAIRHFEAHPSLVILGGKDSIGIAFEDERQWAHGGEKEAAPGDGFRFVTAVNRAPMWIRRELYLERLRHIDFRFAPFQFDDYELCARAWLEGLQVGWYDARFRSLTAGGMRLWNNAFTKEQSEKNGKLLYQLYSSRREELTAAVQAAR